MTAQRDELDHDYGTAMQNAWEGGLGDFETRGPGEAPMKFDDEGVPVLGPYVFGMCMRGN